MIINHTLKSSLSQSYQLTNDIHQMSKYSLGWKIKLNPHCALIWKKMRFENFRVDNFAFWAFYPKSSHLLI